MSNFGEHDSSNPFEPGSGPVFPAQTERQNKALSVGRITLIVLASLLSLACIVAVLISLAVLGSRSQSASSGNDKNYDERSTSQESTSSNASDETYTGGDPLLYDLNSSGSIYWSADPFNYLGSYPPLAIYLSDSGNDGSYCALWLYGSYEEAGQAADGGDFSNLDSPSTWGESTDGILGFVLVADSQTTQCATQAFKFLGY